MAISYRYHVGSFVAIFLALLVGILVGIGLAPRPEEFDQRVAELRQEYRETRQGREDELEALRGEVKQANVLAKEGVSALVSGRLAGKRVAVILNHDFGRDALPESLRALMKQAGVTVTSTTTIARDFVSLPAEVREEVSRRLLLYPPRGTHFRTLIAQSVARDLARGRPSLIADLEDVGLLRSTSDSDYGVSVDAVLLVGGLKASRDASLERIDAALIQELTKEGLRVVGCESSQAPISCMPTYQGEGIPTVDNVDTLAGRLAVVLAVAGADGNFGVKETADRLLPPIPPAAAR